jgi:hypothetical protein
MKITPWLLSFLLAVLTSCETPQNEHALIPTIRRLGADLPVRSKELLSECELESVSSTRLHQGLRGGWGGVAEIWQLPDGARVVATFSFYAGGWRIVTPMDPVSAVHYDKLPFTAAESPSRPKWYNGISFLDSKGRIRYRAEKLPLRKS